MLHQSPIGPNAIGAFLLPAFLLAVLSPITITTADASPFLARDQNPFVLVYGQPLPTEARLPAANKLEYAFSVDITNTLNTESSANERLYADFEAYSLTLGGIYGLNDRWALKLDIPFIYRGGGIFDHAIDQWHKLFGLPRNSRPAVADDQFEVLYVNNAEVDINLNSPQSGIADTQLGLGVSLYQTTDSAVSLWGSIDIPVGDKNRLTGNDDLDYSLWLAGSRKAGKMTSLDSNMGLVLPGDSVLAGLQTEELVFFGHVGADIAVHPTFALKLQLAGHSGYYRDTGIEFLGNAVLIIFGGSIVTGKCSRLDIGLNEDIKAGASPDVGLLISWKSGINSCKH